MAEESEAAKASVLAFLSTVVNAAPIHEATISLGGMLLGTNASTGMATSPQSVLTSAMGKAAFLLNIPDMIHGDLNKAEPFSKATEVVNALLDDLKDPNIEGIPIKATQELETTNVTVSKQVMIDEVAANKRQVVDSAMPELRTWTIKGYLTTSGYISKIDASLRIKPGLVAQRSLLQMFADSRRPVLYKTHDNRFYTVLISGFETSYSPQYLNGLECTVRLVEFKTLSVDSNVLGVIISKIRS